MTDDAPYDDAVEQPEVPGNAPLISMSSPDGEPLPGEAGKITTGRIPKPIPRGADTHAEPIEEPLSSDTIAMKRMERRRDSSEPVVSLDEQPAEQPAAEQPPAEQPVAEQPVEPVEEEKEKKPARRLKIFCHNCGQKLDLTDMEPFSEIDCPSCGAPIIVPRWFDAYLLEEMCGVGGMASVYRGLDLALDREVAIKILNLEVADDEERAKLFLHEARTAATLNHYAILPIYTCGEYEGQPYIVMQFMAGGSLDVEIENHKHDPIPVGEARKWLKDAAEGLDNARRHGIIHHDVKPGNLMLDDDRNVKIGDFGIAQAMHDTNSMELDEAIRKWGSPHYVSPEKVETKKESYLGDVYSLGATFYHVLTGHTPFDSDDIKELLKMKTVRDPLHITKLRNDIPPALADLIMSMMDRTPEARPSYRDIVAEINAMTKAGPKKKPAAKKRAAAPRAPEPRMSRPQSNGDMPGTKANIEAMKPHFTSDVMREGARKKSPVSLLAVLLILLLVGGGAYLAYDSFVAGGAPPEDADYLPDVTEYFAKGDTKMGGILAEEAFKSAGEDLDVKRQAAVQMAIASMLNKERGAKAKCGSILADLAMVEIDPSPESAILEYLSSKRQKPRTLRSRCPSNGPRMACEVAIMVKAMFDGDTAPVVDAYKNFVTLSRYVPDKYWAAHSWKPRVPLWMDWLSKGSGSVKKLEPLVASMKPKSLKAVVRHRVVSGYTPPASTGSSSSGYKPPPAGHMFGGPPSAKRKPTTSLTLDDLTPEWLEEHRKFAETRPRPTDFTFSKSSVEDYLAKLPKDVSKREAERAGQIMTIKQHLCAMMYHMPYENAELNLKDGRTLKGSMMANTKFISIKPASGSRTRLGWSDLPPKEVAAMLGHYAEIRGGADAGVAASSSKTRWEAAWEYLRAGVLCDWYGDYENAVKYAKKAAEYDPRITNEAIIYMLE